MTRSYKKKEPDGHRKIIKEALGSIILVLQVYGCRSQLTEETVDHWMRLTESAGGNWMKVAKYKLAAFFSFHTGCTIPIKPFQMEDRPDFLLGGGAGRWLKSRLKESDRMEVLFSIKQSKKGMPRPDGKMLREATERYVKHMTEERKGNFHPTKILVDWADPPTVDTPLDTSPFSIEQQLRRTVREVFQGKEIQPKDLVATFFPSTSANYINNREEAGAIGTLLDHPELFEGLRGETDLLPEGGKTPFSPGISIELNLDEDDEATQLEAGRSTSKFSLDTSILDKRFEVLWGRIKQKAMAEQQAAKPVALAEALKVRMITKGPPFTQTLLHGVWKFVHTILRRHPTFELIGKPISEEIVLNGMRRVLREGEVYLSGDYEAATDNILKRLSEIVADEIAIQTNMDPEIADLLQKSLTGHLIEGKVQTIGQLMGSITSFPILNLIVATAGRWAVELANNRSYSLLDCPLRVNGDDHLLRAYGEVYNYWKMISAAMGLKESIGKTYVSREFLEMNSMIFLREDIPHTIVTEKITKTLEIERKERECPFRMVKFVNVGLLLGLKRSQASKTGLNDQQSREDDLATRARMLVYSAPEKRKTEVMKLFLRAHEKVLKTLRVPWYIPQWLGGVGLPSGPWGEPSELDRRIAHRILLQWKKERPIEIRHRQVPWKVWEMAQKRLRPPKYFSQKTSFTEEYQHAVAMKCIDLLFDPHVKLGDLKSDIKAVGIKKQLRHNQKLWTPRSETLPRPLTDGELAFQNRYANWVLGDEINLGEPQTKLRDKLYKTLD